MTLNPLSRRLATRRAAQHAAELADLFGAIAPKALPDSRCADFFAPGKDVYEIVLPDGVRVLVSYTDVDVLPGVFQTLGCVATADSDPTDERSFHAFHPWVVDGSFGLRDAYREVTGRELPDRWFTTDDGSGHAT